MRKIVKNQEMNAEKRRYFIFAAIIMIQVVVMLYWANEKSNFYIDELYSMGYASNLRAEGTQNDVFQTVRNGSLTSGLTMLCLKNIFWYQKKNRFSDCHLRKQYKRC